VKLLNSSNDILDLIFIDFDHVSNYFLNSFLATSISLMVLTLDHGVCSSQVIILILVAANFGGLI